MHSSKNNIQYTIAFYYFAFNSIQILILVLFLGHIDIMIAHAFTALISSIIYMFLGSRIFHAVSSNFFTYSFTLFMMIYGILILLNNDLWDSFNIKIIGIVNSESKFLITIGKRKISQTKKVGVAKKASFQLNDKWGSAGRRKTQRSQIFMRIYTT